MGLHPRVRLLTSFIRVVISVEFRSILNGTVLYRGGVTNYRPDKFKHSCTFSKNRRKTKISCIVVSPLDIPTNVGLLTYLQEVYWISAKVCIKKGVPVGRLTGTWLVVFTVKNLCLLRERVTDTSIAKVRQVS